MKLHTPRKVGKKRRGNIKSPNKNQKGKKKEKKTEKKKRKGAPRPGVFHADARTPSRRPGTTRPPGSRVGVRAATGRPRSLPVAAWTTTRGPGGETPLHANSRTRGRAPGPRVAVRMRQLRRSQGRGFRPGTLELPPGRQLEDTDRLSSSCSPDANSGEWSSMRRAQSLSGWCGHQWAHRHRRLDPRVAVRASNSKTPPGLRVAARTPTRGTRSSMTPSTVVCRVAVRCGQLEDPGVFHRHRRFRPGCSRLPSGQQLGRPRGLPSCRPDGNSRSRGEPPSTGSASWRPGGKGKTPGSSRATRRSRGLPVAARTATRRPGGGSFGPGHRVAVRATTRRLG